MSECELGTVNFYCNKIILFILFFNRVFLIIFAH
jgi:hypothetical protein